MFDLNGTFFIFIALFLGFIFLFNEIALKPVGQVIEARKQLIKDDLEAAQKSRQDAEAILSAYEERLQASRMEGQRIIQEVLQSSQAKRKEELSRIHVEGNRKIEEIRSELAKQRSSLIAQLVDSEVDLVQSIVKKLLGESATLAIDRQQVQKTLEEAS
jgi:F-type H+-transporting ATPase subunit b